MSEEQLQGFLNKVRQLDAFVVRIEGDPGVRARAAACGSHDEIVSLARELGFEIGRRWGEYDSLPQES